MLGNLLFTLNKLNDMSRLFLARRIPDVISGENLFLIFAGQVALITGYLAIYHQYAGRASRTGKNALRLFCTGGIIVAVGHVSFMSGLADYLPPALAGNIGALFLVVIFGMLLLAPGLIWFGVLNLGRPVLARWQWLPLFTGLMGFIGFFVFSGQEITAIFLVFRTLFALGLIGLGGVLWLDKPAHTNTRQGT